MEQDPETGQIQQEYEDEDFLDAVRENEPATTKEVMNTVGVSRTAALYRLNNLEEEGVLKSKEAGTSLVWMVKRNEVSRTDTNPDGFEEVVE
jgi:predicted transcriptional regulator